MMILSNPLIALKDPPPMTTTPEDAPAVPALPGFRQELITQIHAHDSYGLLSGMGEEKLLEPFIIDKAKRKTIPVIGDPDPKTLTRVRQFYAAVGLAVERRAGVMASPVFELSGEGFGRLVMTAGRLVVVNRYLRDIHRFGFPTVEALEQEGDRLVGEAVALIGQHPAVAGV